MSDGIIIFLVVAGIVVAGLVVGILAQRFRRP